MNPSADKNNSSARQLDGARLRSYRQFNTENLTSQLNFGVPPKSGAMELSMREVGSKPTSIQQREYLEV